MSRAGTAELNPRSAAIAAVFVAARRSGRALASFPGALPDSLAAAYDCQEAAIGLWDDRIVGWKAGGIAPQLWQPLGSSRVAGPIFSRALRPATSGTIVEFPVFAGGFAAVEAEFTLRLGRDAPPERLDWSAEQAVELVAAVHVSVETAGSPLATINDLGSIVVAADFGNNAGLILGPEIPDWRDRAFEDQVCRTVIDGREAGVGTSRSLAGGVLESLRVVLENCARRRRPLQAGMLIATGAVTGVHDIAAGQSAQVEFGRYGAIVCRAVPFDAAR